MSVVLNTLDQGRQSARTMVAEHSNHRPAVIYKELTRPADLQAATDLIVREYVAEGYLPQSNIQQTREDVLASLRQYRMYGAWENGQLVAVLGLTVGSRLPMDAVFSQEIEVLRAQGNLVGEIGKFASKASALTTVLRLMLLVASVAGEELDYLVLTVNPCHVKFYTHCASFNLLSSDPRPLPSVGGAPAVGLSARPSAVMNSRQATKSRCI